MGGRGQLRAAEGMDGEKGRWMAPEAEDVDGAQAGERASWGMLVGLARERGRRSRTLAAGQAKASGRMRSCCLSRAALHLSRRQNSQTTTTTGSSRVRPALAPSTLRSHLSYPPLPLRGSSAAVSTSSSACLPSLYPFRLPAGRPRARPELILPPPPPLPSPPRSNKKAQAGKADAKAAAKAAKKLAQEKKSGKKLDKAAVKGKGGAGGGQPGKGKGKADEDDLEAILEDFQKEWEAKHAVKEEIADGPPSRRANATLVACPTGNYLWCIGGEYFDGDRA